LERWFNIPILTREIFNHEKLAQNVHQKGALLIAATDLLSLTLLKAPGEWGADVAIGSAQRFGVPMGFGGPHAGFMAVREGLERSLPGRLVGQSVDAAGNPAFRLALQTREQHIRREKATSNICTAQVLLAVISAFYAMWHGPDGLKHIAGRISRYTNSLRDALRTKGVAVTQGPLFDTFTVSQIDAEAVLAKALSLGINLRFIDSSTIGISLDETTTTKEINFLCEIFSCNFALTGEPSFGANARTSNFLAHPLFNSYHSETAMLRYIRMLSDRDLALRSHHDPAWILHDEAECNH
jgi:glycine dehydrogenase